MTALTANLKHLYQRRGVWLWILYLLCMSPVFVIMGINNDRFMGYLLISFFGGLLTGSLQKEILSKPFSFCLPGHNQIPRRLILWVGIVLNALLGFVFLFYPDLGLSVLPAVLAACVVGMSVYLLSAASHLLDFEKMNFLWFLLVIGCYLAFFRKWDVAFQQVIATLPLIVIPVGLISCWYIWQRMDITVARHKYCGKMKVTMFDCWNTKKGMKYKLIIAAEKEKKKAKKSGNSLGTSSRAEDFFLSRITQAQTGSLQQYIWGALYKSFGLMIPQQPLNMLKPLPFLLPVLCFLCYMPGSAKNIIFAMPCFMIIHASLWVHSSLSVSGGRRERFWSGLTLAATLTTLIAAIVFLAAVLSNLMEGVMPPLTIKGHEFTFNALNISFSIIPFIIVPFVLGMGLVFYKKPMLKIVSMIVVFQFIFLSSFFSNLKEVTWFAKFAPLTATMLLLISWAIFVGVLHEISMRRCLVGGK